MNLLLLSIPTEHHELVAWLERQIVGLNLGQLVAELSVIHGTSKEISLEAICGNQLSQMFESGMFVLSIEQISQLLTNPMSLLDLQEQTFVAGSLYWGQINSETAAGRMAAAVSPAVLSQIRGLESKTINGTNTTTAPDLSLMDKFSVEPIEMLSDSDDVLPVKKSSPGKIGRTGFIRSALLLTCAAAMLMLVFRNPFAAKQTGWGFDRPDALAVQMPAPQFFEHLSESANEWFKKTPQNAAELEQRLTEFSHGCQTLIDAPLPQLDDASREWLRSKCRAWKQVIDGQLASLEESPDRFPRVLEESNAVINKLTVALKAGPAVSA
jgi:hypothetical protein